MYILIAGEKKEDITAFFPGYHKGVVLIIHYIPLVPSLIIYSNM